MGASAVPAVRRRLVGAALRRYREARGFSLQDAGRMLGCDKSKVSRIETGERGVRERDLEDLLAEYGAGDGERAVLLKIYAHCIDGQATAANQRIAEALGTQDAEEDPGDEGDGEIERAS